MDPIPHQLQRVSRDRLGRDLFYLSSDPLPCRRVNYTRPGADRSTLAEADDYLAAQLGGAGYTVEREPVPVQAFRFAPWRPMPHRFARPEPSDPWYPACNLYVRKPGRQLPDEHIVLVAHKDSQSWTDSPGAHDNAVGTCALVELARLLAAYEPVRSIWWLWCNEEHVPWTSAVAARRMAAAGRRVIAALNVDSISGKAAALSAPGRQTNVTRYVTAAGAALAQRMAQLNERYGLGLEQSAYRCERPNDDDGSFIHAGFPAAVLNIGSYPYADPNYHDRGDTPDKVDLDNVVKATQLSLAFVLHTDQHGAAAVTQA